MVRNINPSRLNTRLHLGVAAPVRTTQGTMQPDFKETETVWCGVYTMTVNQQISTLGASDNFDLILIIRHRESGLNGAKYARFKDSLYEITGTSPEWSNTAHSFDLVTIKKVDRIGIY
ncbi:head-tail adaptor protein [Companilactobacillus jidongensis]|uniref:head-tail adaptor protein n=1 Tax=Companilactobacillus jidongensis TaxID=2486006 RepID=UPI000F7ABEFE|nr:head-tail adaptor protein [Companilactobacillus jidongensis]